MSQSKHCSFLGQPDTRCQSGYCTLCHDSSGLETHWNNKTVLHSFRSNQPPMLQYHKYVKISKLSCIYAPHFVPSKAFGWFQATLKCRKPKCIEMNSPVQCVKRWTINPGNGDRLSVRKIVKNKVNIEPKFYRATQSNGGPVKILPVSLCFCRASSHLGTVGTKGWFSQAAVVGRATNGGTFHIYFSEHCVTKLAIFKVDPFLVISHI